MKKQFIYKDILREVEKYADSMVYDNFDTKKVFYHYNEWSGWRFYLKAIRHGDWKSIIAHINPWR